MSNQSLGDIVSWTPYFLEYKILHRLLLSPSFPDIWPAHLGDEAGVPPEHLPVRGGVGLVRLQALLGAAAHQVALTAHGDQEGPRHSARQRRRRELDQLTEFRDRFPTKMEKMERCLTFLLP